MSSNTFNKENLDGYLKELGKEFKKLNGKAMPAEIILIGGAAVIANYGFRDMTTDIDAVIHAASSMKEAISHVGDKFDLPVGWLNDDFVHTGSYSPKLSEYSKYYKTFSNVLEIRTISAEYLVAMKLRAGRKYKNDLSDIIGILAEHQKNGSPITMEQINNAVINLYGSWDGFPEDSVKFIQDAVGNSNLEETYISVKNGEKESKDILIDFEKNYPHETTESNVNDILKNLKNKKK